MQELTHTLTHILTGLEKKQAFICWLVRWQEISLCALRGRGRGVIKDSLLIRSQQCLAQREKERRKIVKGERDIERGSDIHREG